MSDDEVRISLKQIQSVLQFVKIAGGIAFGCITFVVSIAVWAKMADSQLNANTIAIERIKTEREINLKEIHSTFAELQKIDARALALIEAQQKQSELQQKQLDRLADLMEKLAVKR